MSPDTERVPTVVVSGVSRGLGAAVAEDFMTQRANVAGFSRRPSETVDRLRSGRNGDRFYFAEADMLDRKSLKAFVRGAIDRFGTIDVLVNNAAVAYDHVLPLSQDKGIDDTIGVNLTNTIYLTRECLKPMFLRGSGSIVNVSSILGLRGYAGLSIYGATKAGLLGFTRSLAREMGRRGVRVNSVCPGYMESEMSAGLTAEQKQQIVGRTPLGRLATFDDVVPLIRFLAGEESRFITGQEFVVDGGISC